MFPTVANCLAFSQMNKGNNETLNYVLDDVRIGDQLCLLINSLHLATPKPLMPPELYHQPFWNMNEFQVAFPLSWYE